MSSVSSGSKELLEVGGVPVLGRVLEEGRAAGLDRSVVVLSPSKPDLVEFVRGLDGVECVLQETPTGLAPAVVLAAGLEPVLLLLPDTIFFPKAPSARLVKALSRGFDIAIAVEVIPEELVSHYGIVEWDYNSGRISRILEKPGPNQTTSRWAIAARFAISDRTMLFVKERAQELAGGSREIDLPPILSEAIAAGHTAVAIPLETDERRFDCGNPDGYRQACEEIDASL